jgi:hypothetical protein
MLRALAAACLLAGATAADITVATSSPGLSPSLSPSLLSWQAAMESKWSELAAKDTQMESRIEDQGHEIRLLQAHVHALEGTATGLAAQNKDQQAQIERCRSETNVGPEDFSDQRRSHPPAA